eukprot:scaffold18772_cov112-Isochrysis_galbana.AAC.1
MVIKFQPGYGLGRSAVEDFNSPFFVCRLSEERERMLASVSFKLQGAPSWVGPVSGIQPFRRWASKRGGSGAQEEVFLLRHRRISIFSERSMCVWGVGCLSHPRNLDLLATILLDMGRGNLSDDDGVQVFKAHRPDAVPRLHEWPFTEHV